MASDAPEKLRPSDAVKTYRYLRIGMVVAVVLLAASIAIERREAGCWQTSISAYYYTPVRAIFVGGMIAVGFSLIVIKGRSTLEDISLNFAGMLAPVVAVAPTTEVGTCWSVEPISRPVQADGSLAGWVASEVDNNFYALLLAGAIALAVALVVAALLHWGVWLPVEKLERGTWLSLTVTAAALGLGWWLIENWDGFYTRAHGFAAVLMFAFLAGAVSGKAVEHRRESTKYVALYSAVAALMVAGGMAVHFLELGGEYTVFVLEAFEIALFATFWLVQTAENWNERVSPASGGANSP